MYRNCEEHPIIRELLIFGQKNCGLLSLLKNTIMSEIPEDLQADDPALISTEEFSEIYLRRKEMADYSRQDGKAGGR